MQAMKEFYCNDVVYRFNKHGQIMFGVVVDTYENCGEMETSRLLQKGELWVMWQRPNNRGREQLVKQEKVHLTSRCPVEGDIVRRLENGVETQRGYYRERHLCSAVFIEGSDAVIENVSNDRLSYTQQFEIGIPAAVGNKFGVICKAEYTVTLISKDGSIVEITPINNKFNISLNKVCDPWFFLSNFTLGSLKNIIPINLDKPKWVRKTSVMRHNMSKCHVFVVHKITPVELGISAQSISGHLCYYYEVPKEDIPKVKVLRTVDLAIPEFCEQRYLSIQPDDVIIRKNDWIAKQTEKYSINQPKKKLKTSKRGRRNLRGSGIFRTEYTRRVTRAYRKIRRREKENNESEWTTDEEEDEMWKKKEPPTVILGQPVIVNAIVMDSKATVVWQDGSVESEANTTQFYYSVSLDDHEFFPGEWVCLVNSTSDEFGVIQKVSYLERTALVKWFQYDEDSDDAAEVICTSETSVYEIKRHPLFVFRPGCIVYRNVLVAYNLGVVLDSFPEGFIQVKWIDGRVENCFPRDLCILKTESISDLDSEHSLEVEMDTTGHESWETESIESFIGELPEPSWAALATRLRFIRLRIKHIKNTLTKLNGTREENWTFLKQLLTVYENSSYLDKLLETQYFDIRSAHYQLLLNKIKEKAKAAGVEISNKIVISNAEEPTLAEFDNITRVMKQECRVRINLLSGGETSTPTVIEENRDAQSIISLCIELLSMLKCRMDLAYTEVVTRIGGPESLDALAKVTSSPFNASYYQPPTPLQSLSSTPDDSLTTVTCSTPKLSQSSQDVPPKATKSHESMQPKPTTKDQPRGHAKTQTEDKATAETQVNAVVKKSSCSKDSGTLDFSLELMVPNVSPQASSEDLLDGVPSLTFQAIASSENELPAVCAPSPANDVDTRTKMEPFECLDEAPVYHRYYEDPIKPVDNQTFFKTVKTEINLLRDSLPSGVWVLGFSDRTDLYSVMIRGPDNTPYEDGLFIFDLQLSAEYPRLPPQCSYISYHSEHVNPNLYVQGRVCISLLGTWLGRGTETWTPNSTLLQLIVSIQGLILVAEPYYNEAGYYKQCNSQQGNENSRTYNELVLLRLVQSMTDMLDYPYEVFSKEIYNHFREKGVKMIRRLTAWIDDKYEVAPEFPLLPVSRGLQFSLRGALQQFQLMLEKRGLI